MASPSHKTMLVFASILIIEAYFSVKQVDAAPLDDVCRWAFDQHFCLTNFGWQSSTKTAPMPELAKLALQKVTENLNSTEAIIQNLLKSDNEHHNILLECDNLYRPALASILATGSDNLKYRQLDALSRQAKDAYNAADHCQSAYGGSFLMAPFETPIYNLKRLANILDVICYFFKF